MRRPAIIIALLSACLLSTAAFAAYEPAPGWELSDLEGQNHKLSDWRGKWVLLKLGTTTCPNCTILLEQLTEKQDELRSLGVELVDIYLRDRRYAVKKYVDKHADALPRTILYDWKGSLVQKYGVSIIPHVVLIDPEGNIRWEGRMTPADEVLAVLRDTVGEASASKP